MASEPHTSDRLLALSRDLLAAQAPDRVLAVALDGLIELTGAERGLVLLDRSAAGADGAPGDDPGASPPSLDAFRVEVARNLDRRDLERPAFEVSRGLLEEVLATGAPCFRRNALEDETLGHRQSVLRLGILSVICLPIHRPTGDRPPGDLPGDGAGAPFGLLYLDHRSATGVFDRATAELGERFAELISLAAWSALERSRLEERVDRLASELETRRFGALVTGDPGLQEILETVSRVAEAEVPLLVRGETGTGKELVARGLHGKSRRRRGPFVAVNCGALPDTLLEAELFGHVRGAFTGAVRDAPGWFERARGGTLLLDEVGEMSPSCQAKMLRVLETGEFSPVGSAAVRQADVRLVAATHRDLAEEAEHGRFREDLLYRLNVVEVVLPPLRERRGDVLLLARHFLDRLADEAARDRGREVRWELSTEARRALLAHPWPGNGRELLNALRRATLLAPGPELQVEHLPPALQAPGPPEPPGPRETPDAPGAPGDLGDLGGSETLPPPRLGFKEAKARTVEGFERDYLTRCLVAEGGVIAAAARRAGIDYKNFYSKLRRYGIDARRYRDGEPSGG